MSAALSTADTIRAPLAIPPTVDVSACRDCGSTALADTSHGAGGGHGCRARHEDDCICGEDRCDDCHSTERRYVERPTWQPALTAALAAFTAHDPDDATALAVEAAEALCLLVDDARWGATVAALHATTPAAEWVATGRMYVLDGDERDAIKGALFGAAASYAATLRGWGVS